MSNLGKPSGIFKLHFNKKVESIDAKWTEARVGTYGCFDPLYVLTKIAHDGGCKFSSFL